MNNPRRRAKGLLLLAVAAIGFWYAMMIVHESGHMLAAWLSGGRVARVVLEPLGFSRTDLASNPRPRFVASAGAIWGALCPVFMWLVAPERSRFAYLARAFAGFCLIANGAYMASAIAAPAGDAEDLLQLGVSRWALALPGMVAVGTGLALWNGLGAHFGLGGRSPGPGLPPA